MTVWEASQLTVHYGTRPVIWDLCFQVPPGHLVGILGPNGAGKSTLLKASLGLVRPSSGTVRFWGEPWELVRQRVAYVPQRAAVDWDFPLTALQFVLMGRYGRLGPLRWPRRADRQAALHQLRLVGMEECAGRQIGQLSGGQQQRLFLARALLQGPDLYLLDEPFVGIDVTTQQWLIQFLKQLVSEGKTICVVHHDLTQVEDLFTWLLLLNMRLVASGPMDQVFIPELVEQTYGAASNLLEEVVGLSRRRKTGAAS